MTVKARVAFLLALAAPTVCLAAAPAGEGADTAGVLPTVAQGIVPMLVSLVVFGVVFAILSVKVWPAISNGLKEREDKIRNEIEAAEMAQEQAKAALEQYEKNLAQARAEAQKMLDNAKSEQMAIAAELKAKSEAELNQMRDKAKRDIESAKAAAVIELNDYAAAMATEMARKILRREINPGDQSRLISESMAELQGSRN